MSKKRKIELLKRENDRLREFMQVNGFGEYADIIHNRVYHMTWQYIQDEIMLFKEKYRRNG